jgi:hypothetical protein
MRVLFDQATLLPIRGYLDQHSVSTASQQGWDKLKNGGSPALSCASNGNKEKAARPVDRSNPQLQTGMFPNEPSPPR